MRNPLAEQDKDIMARALPWLVEERTEDGTRLLRRCCELSGGCGESIEIELGKTTVHRTATTNFTVWYRAHSKCGLSAVQINRKARGEK